MFGSCLLVILPGTTPTLIASPGLEVLVKAQLPDDTVPKDIVAEFYPHRVSVSVKGSVLLSGTPAIDLDFEEAGNLLGLFSRAGT